MDEAIKRLKMDITITNDVCIFFDGEQYHDINIDEVKEAIEEDRIDLDYRVTDSDEDGFLTYSIDWDLLFYENEEQIKKLVYEKFIKISK